MRLCGFAGSSEPLRPLPKYYEPNNCLFLYILYVKVCYQCSYFSAFYQFLSWLIWYSLFLKLFDYYWVGCKTFSLLISVDLDELSTDEEI